MALDIDRDRFVNANRKVVSTIGVSDYPFSFLKRPGLIVQPLVQVTHCGIAKIDSFHVRAP
ncbi:hypothetical protein D3C76_1754090 [compost metagenome]